MTTIKDVTKSTQTIAVLISNISNPFFSPIRKKCSTQGFKVIAVWRDGQCIELTLG